MPQRYAYSYLRMSTDIQLKGDSKRRQLELSQKYAEENNLILVGGMEDIGVSAYKSKNLVSGSLGRFIEALKQGKIHPNSVLLVESLDRLSRDNVIDAFELFISIINLGMEIVTLTDNQTYSKESLGGNPGQLFLTLGTMLRANDESATKSKRLSASWKNKRALAEVKVITGRSPAWLTVNPSTGCFEVIKEAADIVQQIFQWSIEGHGAYSITRKLNEENYQTIGKSQFWQQSYVTKILCNPAVHGEFQPMYMRDGKRVPTGPLLESYFPVIVEKETFLLSRARIESRKLLGGGRKGKSLNNLFTKLIECSKCESSVVFANKGKGPKGGKYLQCYNSKSKAGCDCPPWNYKEFELSFFKYVSEIDIEDVAQENEVASRKSKLRDEIDILSTKIAALLKKKENFLSRLADDIPKELISDIYSRINELTNEIHDLEVEAKQSDDELNSIESTNISEAKELSENYYKKISSNSETSEETELRFKLHQTLVNSIIVIELKNQPIESIPYYTASQLDNREIEILKQGKEYTDTQFDDFILSPNGNKFLNKVKRSFRVYFKNGSVREVNPDTNRTMIVKQSRDKVIKKLKRTKDATKRNSQAV